MSEKWTCSQCGETNYISIIRCSCGNEATGDEEKIDEQDNQETIKKTDRWPKLSTMGLFSSTPEEKAEKERKRSEEAARKAEATFAATPPGQARAARKAGATIFQIDIPLSKTTGVTVAMMGAFASTTPTTDCSAEIQAVEAEGWRLEHAGYVYRVTGSVSRDKFLASGQQEAVHGEIVGIFLFRAT